MGFVNSQNFQLEIDLIAVEFLRLVELDKKLNLEFDQFASLLGQGLQYPPALPPI